MTSWSPARFFEPAKKESRRNVGALSPDLERRVMLTRAALLWETLCAAFWPLAVYMGALAAVSLLDLWDNLPNLAHAVLFWLALAGFLALFWRGVRKFAVPSWARAIERLESGNRLHHRPIAALADVMAERPAAPIQDEQGISASSRVLWREHIRRARAKIGRPKIGWPSPELARRDPRALRAAVLLLLAVGFAAAGSDWSKRLFSGFAPSFGWAAAGPVSLDAWIAPPDYTGHAPIFLHSGEVKRGADVKEAKALRVPAGSKFVARLGGGTGPEILVDGKAKDFRRVDKGTEELTFPVDKDQTLAIRRGGSTIGSWAVSVIPDRPPAASFLATPEATTGYALHVQFGAADDYGVESVRLKLTQPDKDNDKDAVMVDLPVARGKASVSGDHYQDLTDNPWAGETVIGRIEARDALGQIGLSEPVRFVLPEREFTNPVAKKIIALRKHLKDHPGDRTTVMAGLAQLSDRPQDFNNDVTTALALGDAYWRLEYDKSPEAIDTVRDTLWKTAVHLENDRLNKSRNDLRALMEQLQKALAEGAPQAEIERLMNALQAALEDYLRAMQAAGKQKGDQSAKAQQSAGQQSITPDQLRKMLDQARSMSQTGARQAASQLLSQLQSVLENLSTEASAAQDPGRQAMQNAIAKLDALARSQQSLMDQTFRQGGRGQQGRSGEDGEDGKSGQGSNGQDPNGQGGMSSMRGLAGKQGNLRQELGQILKSLDGKGVPLPDTLSKAGSSMGQAESALDRSDRFTALDQQGEALQNLRTGIGQLVDSINQKIGAGQGGNRGTREGNTGGFSTEHVDLPSDADVQRSREILDELRRRSGDWNRPREELDYINRLLDVF